MNSLNSNTFFLLSLNTTIKKIKLYLNKYELYISNNGADNVFHNYLKYL